MEQLGNGTVVPSEFLAGTEFDFAKLGRTDVGGMRIVHKQRFEYDSVSKVYALIKQYAEFPGFGSVSIKNSQGALGKGYTYQSEMRGFHGDSLKPSDEVYKCRESSASDPISEPFSATKLGEMEVDGRTLREFEILNEIDEISLLARWRFDHIQYYVLCMGCYKCQSMGTYWWRVESDVQGRP
ncbi:hypothetical protein NFJ02_18g31660 [Pycnococcus provasolii]